MNGSFLGSLICCGIGACPIASRNDRIPFISMTSPILSLGFALSSHHSQIFRTRSLTSVYGGSTFMNGTTTHERSEPTTIGAFEPIQMVAPRSPVGLRALVILAMQCMQREHSALLILSSLPS